MNENDYSAKAVAFVNLLVPMHFDEAAELISDQCTYSYQDKILAGSSVINAFKESHEKAVRELDSIEYLSASVKESGPNGIILSVSDKIALNGKSHIYRDQLEIRMERSGMAWKVVHLAHLPISEERAQLREFLQLAGPKHS